MNQLVEVMKDALKSNTQSGSDYTAEVTRVEGNTAYVRIAGSDITDTPVAMSISAKAGDKVRVRVADGKAWITGNDTAPPADNTELQKTVEDTTNYVRQKMQDNEGNYSQIRQDVNELSLEVSSAEGDISTLSQRADQIVIAVGTAQSTADGRMKADMSNKASSITIGSGQIAFNSNTLVVNSSKFQLDANGNATFSGNLSAAGGTFKGSVVFPWSSSVTRNIYINDTTKWAPIVIQGVGEGGLGALETSIMSGYIEVSQAYQDKSAMLTPTGVQTFSDARLKKDVKDINPEIAKRLRPVQFRFKKSEDIEYGFIAQEVQEIIPAAVNKSIDNEYLMLNYQELIAPLYALVHEQEDRINQLEERLSALEGKK